MRPKRVLAYCRVSSEEQERSGTSLAAQRDEITRHCAAFEWPPPRFYVEAKSAADADLTKRPQARALLEEARPGDVVVVAKQDRWTRNASLYMDTMRALQAAGAQFFSLAERFDRTVPEGRFAANISATTSEFERERIFERTVGARRKLRDAGCWTEGVAPFGYTRDPKTRKLLVQPEEAATVRDVYARSIAGQALPTIAQALRDAQVGRAGKAPIRWDRKAVHNILRKRWYAGEIRHTDGSWDLAHEPIVTRAIQIEAERSLTERRRGGRRAMSPRTMNWLLRGTAVCGSCGARMGAVYGPPDWPYGYYGCNFRKRGLDCDEPYARAPDCDAQADRAMVRRLEELRHELAKQRPAQRASSKADDPANVAEAIAKAKARRQRTVSLHVDGTISREELHLRVPKIDAEVLRLEHRLAELGRSARARMPEVRAETLANVEQIRKAWGRLDVPKRRELIQSFSARVVIADRVVKVHWKDVEALSCTSR